MVVGKLVGSRIKAIDSISTRYVTLVEMGRTVGLLAILSEHVQGLVRSVSRVALVKRAASTAAGG